MLLKVKFCGTLVNQNSEDKSMWSCIYSIIQMWYCINHLLIICCYIITHKSLIAKLEYHSIGNESSKKNYFLSTVHLEIIAMLFQGHAQWLVKHPYQWTLLFFLAIFKYSSGTIIFLLLLSKGQYVNLEIIRIWCT